MSKKEDGGPVFQAPEAASARFRKCHEDVSMGLTVRDYFAAKALHAMNADDCASFAELSEDAYALADAMLLERAK